MHDFFRTDVLFLHAPSVYDFRKETLLHGPVSDVIPSSSVFEMYPIGITSIADRLERAGFTVQLINVAYRMLKNPRFDPERLIRRANPRLWALDIHWLPHAHGALELAELIKKHHPSAPVLVGGLSASYYHEELIRSPYIDYVMRGDSTEEPVLQLLRCLRTGVGFDEVPNLTWKGREGDVAINPLSHVPDNLDHLDLPAYRYIMRQVFKYWNLKNIIPYIRWLENPMTALLTARGCSMRCSICGGSRLAYQRICNRFRPAFRSPAKLIEDLRFIARFSRGPVFMIHDPRMGGLAYAGEFFYRLRQERLENEMIFELFFPGDETFFRELHAALPRYSVELTLESHDPELRKLNGKFPYGNEQVESTIAAAFANGCRRFDLYFMVGIPHQTPESALASIEYARRLLAEFGRDGRLQIFVAPLGPFLDPGSAAFENGEKYGYRLRAHTLAEHRQRLTEPTWTRILNYESVAMPPEALVETTYEAAARLTRIKAEFGLVTPGAAEHIIAGIGEARELLRQVEAAALLPEPGRKAAMTALHDEARRINKKRLYRQKEFVNWGDRRMLLKPFGLLRLMGELLVEELKLAYRRYVRRLYKWNRV